ncbi:MAG: 50S ribosomal protein L17 [Proteobacteria bacterium]|nr:50S ribosomal protein L17 [Pseudomonadota bacterium]MBQ4361109.1 50S ribosomal protein L17 [Pseudomonadota bacterium]
MRHRKSGRHFSRPTAHRSAMFENLATQLLDHEAIVTTEPKAKELRSVVDKLITIAKRAKSDDIHARRIVAARLNQRAVDRSDAEDSKNHNSVLKKLFDDIAKRNANRPGGYTRIVKLGNRHGDNAPMVLIELVEKAVPAEVVPAFQATTAE